MTEYRDTQNAIIGGAIIILALILIRRGTKKKRAYQGWTPLAPLKSIRKIDKTTTRARKGHMEHGSGYYRTGNREYDKRVDTYSIPGTYEVTRRRKKKEAS